MPKFEVGEIVRYREAHASHRPELKAYVGEAGEVVKIMELESGPRYLVDFGGLATFPRWWISELWLEPPEEVEAA